ncbi:indolepyruvate ferredoxin oxidoreductase family protein [Sphingobium sp. DEHP117]|uniref:indolepyruvate ferredoxin oxidoreductase family protein n=1 Tax=Sphingobium sp. DEHP117 TaxID=2993436 RepID=UPI0027D5B9D1|nr:indolepyruvate ferredoxin oxidoreductase family protein [Sphingobium sp. DEHP117]MDQ4420344.1 indolepyruvate ferredoxin oxidoreductase family protein [Sphingobium sp. DEHP117]
MTKSVQTLDDKYTQTDGEVLIGALQAVVRLLIDQAKRDAAAGLRTAGYVTGYRGSPVTTLDAQLWSAAHLLDEHDIRFEPGLNEELAATSLRGTQQVNWFGKARVEGVFALWYAKGIGVDRAHEALKLGNLEGTAAKGGVLLLAGDDHGAKSSASAHQSDQNLAAALIPTLYPATSEELLSYGQFGWAMSRYSGLYSGFKTITDTLDLTQTVALPAANFAIALPDRDGPPLSLVQGRGPLEQEALTVDHRLPAAQAFVRSNALDRITHGGRDNNLTIVTAGKSWLDTAQALSDLGLTQERCEKLGIRVVKLALTWPVEPQFLRASCAGAREVLVVEEKRGFVEDQVARLLYGLANAPLLSGKCDPAGAALIRADNVLDAAAVRRALVRRLADLDRVDEELRCRADSLAASDARAEGLVAEAVRPAYFCSGCPHNLSTVVPDGSAAMGATGCHGLAHFMPSRNTMATVGMGSEGMPWVAAQTYVDTPHYFQNLGDGTYTHSGLLTIRAAVAAKSRVTYKILYNDAVAMTGGQPMEGGLSPVQIVHELVAEGVDPVVLISEDPSRFSVADLPAGVRLLHRDYLDQVQRELRQVAGTSAIVYDSTCANEKRRRRKRGRYPDPAERLFINQAVCEGCGDCSQQSNCLSVEPVETEFGRKRRINQSTCNKDFSCIKGFCPSFVTVIGGRPARREADVSMLDARISGLPAPEPSPVNGGYDVLVTGIGGTGVLTVGAVLAMAAHIEGKAAKLLDMTGMAQKGGAVVSHLRIAEHIDQIPSARVGTGEADLIIACDLVVATAPDVMRGAGESTRLICNEDVVPTGEFQTNQALDLSASRFLSALAKRVSPDRTDSLRAGELATRLMGDAIFTNFLMVGYALQKGLLPLGVNAIEEALIMNGVSVKQNIRALQLGRLAAVDPGVLLRLAGIGEESAHRPATLGEMLESRRAFLRKYQNDAWANRYAATIAAIEGIAASRGIKGYENFLVTCADQLARLMAYKDEYEVARLYTSPEFKASVEDAFEGDYVLQFNLAPPLLPLGKDPKTGRPRKIRLGRWIVPVFRALRHGKMLRGTPFDLFGYTAERRMERALIGDYEGLIASLAGELTQANLPLAQEIAGSVWRVRGYGPVKHQGVAEWRAYLEDALPRFRAERS